MHDATINKVWVLWPTPRPA